MNARAPRPFALIRTHDQWLRVSHERTTLAGEVVSLTWTDDKAGGHIDQTPFAEVGASLAFDEHCRLYHSMPEAGRVQRHLWAVENTLTSGDSPEVVDLFEEPAAMSLGEFTAAGQPAPPLNLPRGLAVDADGRLFIAESGAKQIVVVDLWSRRVLQRVPIAATPVDLASAGQFVYVLATSPASLLKLEARNSPEELLWPAEITNLTRIAVAKNRELYVLNNGGQQSAEILKYKKGQGIKVVSVEFATDIEFQTGAAKLSDLCPANSQVLVVARRPGEDFRRFCVGVNSLTEAPPLKARGYDGLGIVCTPDGRIGFWTAGGFRHGVPARLKYASSGEITTFQLDSGEFQTVWGRVFIDACIPRETNVTVRCIAADEPPEDAAMTRKAPEKSQEKIDQSLSAPMPPQSLADEFSKVKAQSLHRRETGRELPWTRLDEDDPFETYEAPIIAVAGRYLWLRFELTGNTRTTPRLRCVRAEYPSHDYLRRIPKTFSRDPQDASFLRRYLAMFEGTLGEMEAKANTRATLLDPRSAPPETLPWLASFLGLALDERMARAPRPGGVVDVRRQLIQETIWLFRFRGTVRGLRRFLEIYLGVKPIIIEKFRARGLGGVLLGESAELISNSVLGAGFRIGGAIGQATEDVLGGTLEDAFKTHAHRFTLIIPANLNEEGMSVVQQILDVHRPAHTLVDVCTAGAGMRVGRGLHLELTSVLGRSGGFETLRAGSSFLGRGAILGRPDTGSFVEASYLGENSRVG